MVKRSMSRKWHEARLNRAGKNNLAKLALFLHDKSNVSDIIW